MTARVVHEAKVDHFGGSHYAFCHPWACGWTGPWRRWAWRARRDARRHLTAFRPRLAPLSGKHTTDEEGR